MKLNGDFFAKSCAPTSIYLAKKFGEIDPRNSHEKNAKNVVLIEFNEIVIDLKEFDFSLVIGEVVVDGSLL
jgi:hypothetical protein